MVPRLLMVVCLIGMLGCLRHASENLAPTKRVDVQKKAPLVFYQGKLVGYQSFDEEQKSWEPIIIQPNSEKKELIQEQPLDVLAIERSLNRQNPNKKLERAPNLAARTNKSEKSNKKSHIDEKVVYQKNGFLNTKKVTIRNRAWVWPVEGKLLQPFTHAARGIQIAGELGDPVVAASDGKVLYAGDDVVGYGNLIILQHSGGYLSAYAHNSRILVEEGQLIKAQQVIAEIGSSGTNVNKLHFEIRKEGKPLDPVAFLEAM